MPEHIYIASHDRDGGILHCRMNGGALELLERYPMDRPAYLCRDGNTLYALLREPFMQQSGVARFEIDGSGRLTRRGEIEPVHGTVAAHILADRGRLYCANYLSGSVTLMPDTLLAFSGRGADPARQDCSHPHCVVAAPDGEHICITDLGTDRIYVCTRELRPVSTLELPAGSGPRHLVFSRDGRFAYCANELSSTVSVLSYAPGRLSYERSVPSVPGDYAGENSAAAIRLSPDGGLVCVSNRGHGSVAVFRADGPMLEPLGCYRVPDAAVREFNFSGRYILLADDSGGQIFVFDTGLGFGAEPVSRFQAARPWCVLTVGT